MRRVLVVLCSFLMLGVGLPPAHADQTIEVNTNEEDYFPGTSAFTGRFGCAGPGGPANPFLYYIEADNPPPPVGLGARSWGLAPSQGGATGNFFGIGVELLTPGTTSAALDTFSIQVYGAAASTGRAAIFAWPPGTVSGGYYLGMATVSGGGNAWTTVDAANLSYTWSEYNSSNVPTGVSGGTKTLDAFVTDKGESTQGYNALLGFGCDGQLFFYDGFKWGSSGNVTTLDFEALASQVTMSATPQTITAGKKSTLGGTVDPVFVGGTNVHLEVKAFGSDQWDEVAVVTSSGSGVLTRKVGPLQRAEYRWVFVGEEFGEHYADDISPVQVIKVRTGLTAVVTDPTVQRGQKIVVIGATNPDKPGQVVTLWRKTATGKTQLGAAIVKDDGTYKVTGVASSRGEWKVFTTIPSSPGNLAGTSPKRTVTIS